MTRDEAKPTALGYTHVQDTARMDVSSWEYGLKGHSPGFMSFSSNTDSHLAPVPRMVIL